MKPGLYSSADETRGSGHRQVFRNVRRVNSEASPIELAIVPHYRARPLDGVWATAPYLHNGSVPTLQDMLTPQDERPKKFCVGSRQFDPINVGLATKEGQACAAYTTLIPARPEIPISDIHSKALKPTRKKIAKRRYWI